jgi:hypothetical protein
MHRAALRPSVPAGAQIAFDPVQSAAFVHASEAHTLVGTTAGPPQLGAIGPSTHFPGGRASVPQSAVLQHCPGGAEQVVASGTLTAHTR